MGRSEHLKSTHLRDNEESKQVFLLQRFLRRFGYLPTGGGAGEAGTTAQPRCLFDEPVRSGLRAFQEASALPVTGALDDATAKELNLPRCGFLPASPSLELRFVARSRWTRNSLRFAVLNAPAGCDIAKIRGAICCALALWSQAARLDFTESDENSAEIVFSFMGADHSEDLTDEPFDGPGNVLAHAFFPPPAGGPLAGKVHFDIDEPWSLADPSVGTDLVSVAAHEIGHALGLDHSNQRDAMMFPTFSGPQRSLAPDDLNGIRALYGRRA